MGRTLLNEQMLQPFQKQNGRLWNKHILRLQKLAIVYFYIVITCTIS
jgi:hypothetical protein